MTEILAAGITALGLIVVGGIANRGRQHSKAAREQVENSHPTNLRDDIDGIRTAIDAVESRVSTLEGFHRRRWWQIFRR